MPKRALILIDNNNNGFFPKETKESKISELYKSHNIINRVIRKIFFWGALPLRTFFFSDWYKDQGEYELIILFDTGNAKYILPIIQKRFPGSRVILWFWNSASKTIAPDSIKCKNMELWSFDPEDCKKYKMKYNTQFFPSERFEGITAMKNYKLDAFFVGTSKGRIEILQQLATMLKRDCLRYKYHIVGDTTKRVDGLDCNYCKSLKYSEVIQYDLASKAVIDITSPGQHGLTLRPLEALFLKRKLITNFKEIRKYDFYRKANIFVLGDDDRNSISEFLEEPIDETYNKMYYDIDMWIDRFFN